jgi:hypothetical protein
VLEALLVIVVLATVLAGAALPASVSVGGVSPTSFLADVFGVASVVTTRSRSRCSCSSICSPPRR